MSGRDKQSSHPSALASSRPGNQTVENTAARSSALKRDYMKGVIPAIILNTSACEIPHFFFFKEMDVERRMKRQEDRKRLV